MSIVSTFVNVAALQASVKGCPLATMPPGSDESACASCRFNVIRPGLASIGCTLRTPPTVVHAALERLRAGQPALSARLQELRNAERDEGGVEGARAAQWRDLATEWLQSLPATGEAEAREVCTVAGRFAEASLRLSQAVVILR